MKVSKQNPRILLISIIILFFGNHSFGQQTPFACNTGPTDPCNLIANNTFLTNCVPNDPFALQNYPFLNCVNNWSYTHGTPQLPYSSVYLPRIAANTNHAVMWSRADMDGNGNLSITGEGIAVGIRRLAANTTYQLSFSERISNNGTDPLDNYYFVLLTCAAYNNLRRPFDDYTTPAIPTSGAQIIFQGTSTTNINWAQVVQNFVPNANNYEVLWIFPRQATANVSAPTSAYLHIALPVIRRSPCTAVIPVATCPKITPSGPIDYYIPNDNSVLGGFTLTSNSATGNQWYRNGIAISGATGQTHNIPRGYSYGSSPIETYSCVANGCTSNIVTVRYKQYGFGLYGEERDDLYGAKFLPPGSSGFFCMNSTNNYLKQFNQGLGATYSWNVIRTPLTGPAYLNITTGSTSINSNIAGLDVGTPVFPFGTYMYEWIQGISDLNGQQKIIDLSFIVTPLPSFPVNYTTCASQTVNIRSSDNGSYYLTPPGGSLFDWEDYDFGPNSIIISPNPSAYPNPSDPTNISKLHIPGRGAFTGNIQVQFYGNSYVTRNFYYNAPLNGCYTETANWTVDFGCRRADEKGVYIVIYPNPASNLVTFKPTEKNTIIQLIEVRDQFSNSILCIKNNKSGEMTVNTSNLKTGIYFCYIQTAKGIYVKKLSIKK